MQATTAIFGAALAGAALFASETLALADPLAPSTLVPALDLYVDAEVTAHDFAVACADTGSPARDEAAWQAATAAFIATLWANGFPADFVRSATTRLSVPAKPVDCADRFGAESFADPERNGWKQALERPFGGLEYTVVTHPVSAETWAAIKSAITTESAAQSHLMDCVGITYPTLMPIMVHDWDQMIVEIGGKLVAVGLPRDDVASALSAAEANSLWHRTPADRQADLKKTCDADTDWLMKFQEFSFLTLGSAVDRLLPQAAADTDSP